tara:strand:+ start:712 stop:1842 length:1131 start_codon:yes stop_codon:yes gene_type:complete
MGDEKDNKRKSEDVGLSPIFIRKRPSLYNLSDSDNNYDSDVDNLFNDSSPNDSIIDLSEQELVTFDTKINSLEDLIKLGNLYEKNKRYEFDMKKLNKMIPSIEKINNFIGMSKIKEHLVDHILFYLQAENLKINESDKDIMHTVITGPPGVGKTEFARALGELYLSMGILKTNKFTKVTRSDLVAKYLGQTAIKTRDLIKKCEGGILFIDEVYALGNREQKDSFSKEAIDTLNEHLTEKKNSLICIVAGYKDEVNECFFSFNKGLESRFPIRFEVEGYDYKELFQIFRQKIIKSNWTLSDKITEDFFKDNELVFKYYGRDVENFLTQIKRCHSRRVFTLSNSEKTLVKIEDMKNALKLFKSQNKKDNREFLQYLYI